MILADAKNLAFAKGYEMVEDTELLDEVAGLVEWPVALMGAFDESFLAIPPEVIRTTIRNNQKCFVLRDPRTRTWSAGSFWSPTPRRVDGGRAIVAGNERVIRARLSDTKFFYETDLATGLEDRLPKFEQIVFHEKLGRGRAHRAPGGARRAMRAGSMRMPRRPSAPRASARQTLTEVVGEFSGAARADGQILRAGARGKRSSRPCLRGSLQAKRAG